MPLALTGHHTRCACGHCSAMRGDCQTTAQNSVEGSRPPHGHDWHDDRPDGLLRCSKCGALGRWVKEMLPAEEGTLEYEFPTKGGDYYCAIVLVGELDGGH